MVIVLNSVYFQLRRFPLLILIFFFAGYSLFFLEPATINIGFHPTIGHHSYCRFDIRQYSLRYRDRKVRNKQFFLV